MDSFPGALGQVLINLINNAYLHAFEGRTDGRVRIEARVQGDEVHLRTVDNGVGMSTELLAQLFQPFFSTKIGRGGTGLGMTIVENLVKATLGGSMSVESRAGTGTSFHIRVPLMAPRGDDTAFDSHI
jgi:signal transduction histidine kinase